MFLCVSMCGQGHVSTDTHLGENVCECMCEGKSSGYWKSKGMVSVLPLGHHIDLLIQGSPFQSSLLCKVCPF